jgi:hypothetical protein
MREPITCPQCHHQMPRGGRSGRQSRCTSDGCRGEVLRHSLGCGIAIGRCPRCFARYELSSLTTARRDETGPSGLRRLLHEIVTWREED